MATKNSKGNLTISLSKSDHDKLSRMASAMGMTREKLVRSFIREGYHTLMAAFADVQNMTAPQQPEEVNADPYADSMGDSDGHP